MHIPDGYLSPTTCVVLYATAVPFWYVALRRVKKFLSTSFLPLISVFAAFSFVIMMFNLPLPGGTTGHAVGIGIAAVVLGPWASMLAVSIALVIQSLFFGDGGVTAIGANCFNMAIAGSLVAYGAYRILAGKSALRSRRRALSAAVAGYAAINVSAVLAAIEFGLQPLLFHDANGVPLYCPYPLSVSLPAMMLGHLTFAGLAELLVTGGVVAYLQRTDPWLLRRTAPRTVELGHSDPGDERETARLFSGRIPAMRRLWLALAALLILTPLGILATGSAWGEWGANDFADSAARAQIAASSGNRLPPAQPPHGLQRLSAIWTAPLSRYTPAKYAPFFIRYPSLGYLVSAMLGVGLIILAVLGGNWILPRIPAAPRRDAPFSRGFVEGTVRSLMEAVDHAVSAEALFRSSGLLQSLDPRVKLAGLGCLIAAAASVHRLGPLAALFGLSTALAAASRVPWKMLLSRVWAPALSFSGLIAVPAIFLTHGAVLYRVPILDWAVTRQGLQTALFLILRVETASTFSALLILTTQWTRILKALRFFHVPITAVVVLGMTYRYVFLLLRTAAEMFESRRSRLVGELEPADRRRLAAASAGVLLSKSFQLSTEVHNAMRARGYQGEVYLLDELSIRPRDWVQLSVFVALAALSIAMGSRP